nr:hypothetical protein [Burkholderia pseudomallei]
MQYRSSGEPFGAARVAPDGSPGEAGAESTWSYGASAASGEPAVHAGSTSSRASS